MQHSMLVDVLKFRHQRRLLHKLTYCSVRRIRYPSASSGYTEFNYINLLFFVDPFQIYTKRKLFVYGRRFDFSTLVMMMSTELNYITCTHDDVACGICKQVENTNNNCRWNLFLVIRLMELGLLFTYIVCSVKRERSLLSYMSVRSRVGNPMRSIFHGGEQKSHHPQKNFMSWAISVNHVF